MIKRQGTIYPNDNARIDIQRDQNGGALIIVRELDKPIRCFRISRDNAIGMALAMMEASGIPINEAYHRKAAEQKGAQ